jgi:hypothetical protein
MSAPRYDREALARATADCAGVAELQDRLGAPGNRPSRSHLLRRLKHCGVDIAHFTDVRRYGRGLLDREELTAAVAASTSKAEVLRTLGLPGDTTARTQLSGSLEAYGIDTSHFTGQRHRLGTAARTRKSAAQILVRRPAATGRTPTRLLRRALDELGVPRVCSGCGTGESWQGRRLVLEIDHMSGDRLDNRQENLRYLCPNCHSTTPTWCRDRRRPG